MTFRALCSDGADTLTRVARFLALLELFREGVVAFEQATPLGDLHVRWTGTDDGDIDVHDEFDEPTPDGAARRRAAGRRRPTTDETRGAAMLSRSRTSPHELELGCSTCGRRWRPC